MTQDLGFERVSDKSAKCQILPIFCHFLHGDKLGIFKIFSYQSNRKSSKRFWFEKVPICRVSGFTMNKLTHEFQTTPHFNILTSANRLKTLQGYFWHQCRTNVTHIEPIRKYFENANFCWHVLNRDKNWQNPKFCRFV